MTQNMLGEENKIRLVEKQSSVISEIKRVPIKTHTDSLLYAFSHIWLGGRDGNIYVFTTENWVSNLWFLSSINSDDPSLLPRFVIKYTS